MSTRKEALEALHRSPETGEELISGAREILSTPAWLEGKIPEDLFDVFVAIDSQTDHIFLTGFGRFDEPSPRGGLGPVGPEADLSYAPYKRVLAADPKYQAEINDIFEAFKSSYESARLELLSYLESSQR